MGWRSHAVGRTAHRVCGAAGGAAHGVGACVPHCNCSPEDEMTRRTRDIYSGSPPLRALLATPSMAKASADTWHRGPKTQRSLRTGPGAPHPGTRPGRRTFGLQRMRMHGCVAPAPSLAESFRSAFIYGRCTKADRNDSARGVARIHVGKRLHMHNNPDAHRTNATNSLDHQAPGLPPGGQHLGH